MLEAEFMSSERASSMCVLFIALASLQSRIYDAFTALETIPDVWTLFSNCLQMLKTDFSSEAFAYLCTAVNGYLFHTEGLWTLVILSKCHYFLSYVDGKFRQT